MLCSPLRKLSMLDPGQRSHQFSNYDDNLLISGGNIFLRSPEKFSNVSRIFSFASPLWCCLFFFPLVPFISLCWAGKGHSHLGLGSIQIFFNTCIIFCCGFSDMHLWYMLQSLELWNMNENKTMTLPAHEGLIAALAVSTATGLVASASHDKLVKLWKWYMIVSLCCSSSSSLFILVTRSPHFVFYSNIRSL